MRTAARAGDGERFARETLTEVRATAGEAFKRAVQAMPGGTAAVLREPIGAAIRKRAGRIVHLYH